MKNYPAQGIRPNKLCAKCGTPFYASPGHIAKGQGMFCSMSCRPVARNGGKWGKGGTRVDLGIYVRSSWEANYARYLNWLQANGQIKSWEYEPVTFEFHAIKRGSRFYTPDFRITENSGAQKFHEVKGWLDKRSKTKLARMAKYYPEHPVILIQSKEMTELRAKVSALIPSWEIGENDKIPKRFEMDLFNSSPNKRRGRARFRQRNVACV